MVCVTSNKKIPYQLFLDKSYCFEYFLNSEGEFEYISPSCKRITGYNSNEFLKNQDLLTSIIHCDDQNIFNNHFCIVYEASDDAELDFRIVCKDGSVRWISHHCSPVFDDQGNYLGRRGTNMDITRQKQIQEQLIATEKDIDMLFNYSSDGYFYMMIDEPIEWNETTDKEEVLNYVFDHQRITKVNQAFLAQYGATREQAIGITPRERFLHDLEYGKKIWRELFDKGVLSLEVSEQKLTGETLHIEGEYLCIYDDLGRIVGHLGIQRDVTERKKSAEQLESLNKKLEEEMSKAAVIHNRLLPTKIPFVQGVEIEAFYEPALNIGGDFYDIIPLGDDVLIVMVDVSGHGLDGAMIASFIKSCIIHWTACANEFSVKQGLEFIAGQFQKMGYPGDYFVCLFLGIFNPNTNTLSYSTTGFQTKMLMVEQNDVTAVPLGGLPISSSISIELLNLQEHVKVLEQGDMFFLTTDGLIEASRNETLYESRLLEVVNRHSKQSAKAIRNAIVSDFQMFMGEEELEDDVTFLVIKILGA